MKDFDSSVFNEETLSFLVSVISGFDEQDPGSADVVTPDFSQYSGSGVKGLKIGVIKHFYQEDMIASNEMSSGLDNAFTLLSNNGAELKEIKTRPLIDFATCNRIILLSEACAIHQKWLVERTDEYGESLLTRLLPGTTFNAVDYVQAVRTRARYAAEFNEFFKKFDQESDVSAHRKEQFQKWLREEITQNLNKQIYSDKKINDLITIYEKKVLIGEVLPSAAAYEIVKNFLKK